MTCNTGYLSIPVDLGRWALTNHKVNQVKLYIYLKTICSGHFKLSDELISCTCSELSIKSKRTFKSQFKWLIQKKWITVNSKKASYRIIGFPQLSSKLKFSSCKGALFEPMDFSKFKEFLIASVITYYMIRKSRWDIKSELHTRSSRKYFFPPASYSLPHTYLAKILHASKTNAAHFRNLAIKSGYIKAKPKFVEIEIPKSEFRLYKKFNIDENQKFRVIKGKLYRQLNDELTSIIFLSTKKSLQNKIL